MTLCGHHGDWQPTGRDEKANNFCALLVPKRVLKESRPAVSVATCRSPTKLASMTALIGAALNITCTRDRLPGRSKLSKLRTTGCGWPLLVQTSTKITDLGRRVATERNGCLALVTESSHSSFEGMRRRHSRQEPKQAGLGVKRMHPD